MTPTAEQRIAQSRLVGDQQYRELLAYVTGVIESACGYLVKDRMERAGRRAHSLAERRV
jgi:hypothetical protein